MSDAAKRDDTATRRVCRNCRSYSGDGRCMNAETKREIQKLTQVYHCYEGFEQMPTGLCSRFEVRDA